MATVRGVHDALAADGTDPVYLGLLVYGVAEGYRRAAGHAPREPFSMHDDGTRLPDGLRADGLRSAVAPLLEAGPGGPTDGLTVGEIEGLALAMGGGLHAGIGAKGGSR